MKKRGSPENARIFGLPDWRNKESYTKNWNLDRWRWEFTRRRPDIRAAFDQFKQRTHENDLLVDAGIL